VLGDMLVEIGHRVRQAGSGADGHALCEAERFDLVITDLSMPGMSGWDVAASLRRTHPGVAVGLVTGWGEQVDPGQASRHHLKFVLAKPFMLEDVMRVVGTVLDGE
jgi:CheY-like chemotaxis protein